MSLKTAWRGSWSEGVDASVAAGRGSQRADVFMLGNDVQVLCVVDVGFAGVCSGDERERRVEVEGMLVLLSRKQRCGHLRSVPGNRKGSNFGQSKLAPDQSVGGNKSRAQRTTRRRHRWPLPTAYAGKES